MSYRNLEIWKLARKQSILIHKMSLTLPKFELYETGSQIRRSSKSIRSNIVEGYGRRRYKQEYIRFLIFSHASALETLDHLEALFETGSLTDKDHYQKIWNIVDECGRKLNKFIEGVEREYWRLFSAFLNPHTYVSLSVSLVLTSGSSISSSPSEYRLPIPSIWSIKTGESLFPLTS